MKLTNEITLARPPDEVFAELSDVERVAPCLPGVTLEGSDGDEHLGRMAVRVGPISATYRGRLRFVETDPAARRTVMRARADELNGHGSAEASITTAVHEDGPGSRVVVETDLQLRGRVAQFGRGALGPIATRMFEQFARNLEALQAAPSAADGGASAPQPARAAAPAPAELRLGPAVPRDAVVALAAGVAGAVLGFGYGYLAGRIRELRRS